MCWHANSMHTNDHPPLILTQYSSLHSSETHQQHHSSQNQNTSYLKNLLEVNMILHYSSN